LNQPDLIGQLEAEKRAVDRFILDFLPKSSDVKEVQLLYDMIRDYPSRPGKGLRSTLCKYTCEAFGGDGGKVAWTAAAIEIFHSWILIHDDIEDGSEMRRGRPVLHKIYGVPLAINAGDALHAKMWEALIRNRWILGDAKTVEVIEEFLEMINETTEGQHIELSWVEENRWDLREEDYYYMCVKKTSRYTCTSPCRLGGIVAGVGREKLDLMIPFGSDLGIAFQVQDDILNLVGEERKYGKEHLGDLMEGKRTLMLIRLINTAAPEDKKRMLSVMSRKRSRRTHEDAEEMLRLMDRYGVIEYAKAKAEEYAARAKTSFSKIFADVPQSEAKARLEELIDFMVKREW